MRKMLKKIAILLILSLNAQAMTAYAYTNKKVNARNPATLEKSLNDMIADLSLKEQINLMEAFFRTAYASAPSKVPYTRAQAGLFIPRADAKNYPNLSATAFVSDSRMDKMDEATAYTVWKADGWSKKESYVRFILTFGDSVDGLSGHQLMNRSNQASTNQANAAQQKRVKYLEDKRDFYIRTLQMAEARYGACKNFQQMGLRKNIENIGPAIASAKSGQADNFREAGYASVGTNSCRYKPPASPYRGAPIDSTVAAAQSQSQANQTAQEKRFNDAVNRMVVKRAHELKWGSNSPVTGQLELIADVSEPRTSGKTLKRAGFHIIAFPKRGGEPLYFRGRIFADGYSDVNTKKLQLFATFRKPNNYTAKKLDYHYGIVVNEIRYADGSEEKLVKDMTAFKNWVKTQDTMKR